ncbi:hypothetical protein LIER_07065 [Lithospermum erythrorhizon]|uniref:Pentatricopeptide repeat-containing protein n=1 Tax=Lithospermum erythrorhizon TaxID=34254 RepID=A0AAV3P8M8_LITER
MPPQFRPPSAATKPHKPYFFYGHRKPTQNRPTVHGGLFTNRRTTTPSHRTTTTVDFDLKKWYPNNSILLKPQKDPSQEFFNIAKTLSPIARYIVDIFRKNKEWGPSVVAELNKLRRVTPKLVAEVLKVPHLHPRISTKFFHWAGKQKGYKHDFACYNAFAYFLNRTNQFRLADQVPELMSMQGKPPSEKQFEVLIRMHADSGRGLRVYYVYEKMKKFGVKPRVFLYNRIMDALVKTNHLDLAMTVYDDFKEEELVEESVTYMTLIKGLCKAGRMSEVFELLAKMRENLCKPDVFAYTAMIKVLTSEGNLDGCLKVWEEMRKDKIEPDAMAYSTLITALCKENRVEKGYEFFKEMKEKNCIIDRAVYGALVEGFVADGKVGSACDLLQDLMDSGYRADLVIYGALIRGLCDANHVDRAYKLFKLTVQEDLQPDFLTVIPILVSYAESKRMDDFCRLLEQMQKLGLFAPDDLSKFLSYMVRNNERVLMALAVFEELRMKGYCSVQMYNILMDSLYDMNELNRAITLFHELSASELQPDSLTYSRAIQCFIGVGNMQEACLYYNKIIETSDIPSIPAYQSLVKGLCEIRQIDAAMMLIRECLANVINGPLEFKYTLTIIHVCKSNDAAKIIEVVNELMEQGCEPDSIIYSAIISGMCRHGTIEEARKVISSMEERKLLTEAEAIVWDEILVEHMKQKTADLVLSGLKFFGLESKLKAKGSTLLAS